MVENISDFNLTYNLHLFNMIRKKDTWQNDNLKWLLSNVQIRIYLVMYKLEYT